MGQGERPPAQPPSLALAGLKLIVSQSRHPNLYWRASNGQVVIVNPPELRAVRAAASRGRAGERSGVGRRQYTMNRVLRCFSGVTRVKRRTSGGARGCGEAAGTVIITGSVAECQVGR